MSYAEYLDRYCLYTLPNLVRDAVLTADTKLAAGYDSENEQWFFYVDVPTETRDETREFLDAADIGYIEEPGNTVTTFYILDVPGYVETEPTEVTPVVQAAIAASNSPPPPGE